MLTNYQIDSVNSMGDHQSPMVSMYCLNFAKISNKQWKCIKRIFKNVAKQISIDFANKNGSLFSASFLTT